MLPLAVDPPLATGRLKPLQTVAINQTLLEATLKDRPRSHRIAPAHETSEELVVYLSGSTESVVMYSFACAQNTSGSEFLVIEQPAKDKSLLDRSFARAVGFVLEPEQPTDEDLRRRPVYRFPTP